MSSKYCKKCNLYYEGGPHSRCPVCRKKREAEKARESYAKKQAEAALEEQRRTVRTELEAIRAFKELTPALKQQCIEYYERRIRWEKSGSVMPN